MTILINIDVPSLAEGESFYAAAFALIPGRRLGPDVLEMTGWPSPVYLLQKSAGTIGAGRDFRNYARHWTPLHLDIVVTDLGKALARAIEAGASLEQDASPAPFGRIAMLSDPFGHGFCLIEFSGGGYDEMVGLEP